MIEYGKNGFQWILINLSLDLLRAGKSAAILISAANSFRQLSWAIAVVASKGDKPVDEPREPKSGAL